MEPDSDGERNEERLRAEREAILKQLEMLGSDSDGETSESNETEFIEGTVKTENIEDDPVVDANPLLLIDSADEDQEEKPDPAKINKIECPAFHSPSDKSPEDSLEADIKTPFEDDDDEEKPVCSETLNSGTSSENSRSPPVEVQKIVMDRIDIDKSNPLPDGWTLITHFSGMPVYYHKFTQVVTHSRPYQVEGIVRDHEIPISSIPCLYRQVMDKKHIDLDKHVSKHSVTFEERQSLLEIPVKERKMTPDQYREYCEKRFKFKQITVRRYTNTEDKEGAVQQRRVNSMLKKKGFEMDYDQLKKKNNPGEVLLSSASGAILIDLTPVQTNLNNKRSGPKKPYLLNPMGKTTVAVLNEFVQRLAKGTLVYEIEDTRNVSCPYKATAMLTMKTSSLREIAGQCKESLIVLSEIAALHADNSMAASGVPPDSKRFPIGSGVGANKKTARLVAAKDALSKLIPKLRMTDEHVCDGVLEEGMQKGFEEESRELFKKVKIDSPNLVQMCTRFAIQKPYNLLKDAISRSLRWNGMELQMKKEMVGNGSQLSKVILSLGDMEEEAEAIGVKQAQQLASQLLFKKMHPELQTYGSFLEVYGRLNDKSKLEQARKYHDEVVRLQDTGNLLEPNTIVLSKLSEEMRNVCLVHPPRKFLFGLAPQSAGTQSDKKSVPTQTDFENHHLIPNLNPNLNPMALMPSPYFHRQVVPVTPLMHPPMHPISPFAAPPPPPQDFVNYQSPHYSQRNPRKRGLTEESTPTQSFLSRPPHV